MISRDALGHSYRFGSPARFAEFASEGRWRLTDHLSLIDYHLLLLSQRRLTRLIITVPPRHGKSTLTSLYFPAWYLCRHPYHNVFLTSYAADFAASWGAKARNVADRYAEFCFGQRVDGRSRKSNNWKLEHDEGRMECTGTGGQLTGKGAHLIIIDDPTKNSEEARSPVHRENLYNWFLETLYTRQEPGCVMVLIQTRWHEDDLVGRLLADHEAGGEEWRHLNLEALAGAEEPCWPHGLGRAEGQALWPERYDEGDLLRIKRAEGSVRFNCIYQGHPTPPEGALFRREWFKIVHEHPPLVAKVRYWDLAGTDAFLAHDPDWTAGVLMGKDAHENYYVLDVTRFRKGPLETREEVSRVAHLDGPSVPVWVEQDPGQAGKDQIHSYRQRLRSRAVFGNVPSGSKITRAEVVAACGEDGCLKIFCPGGRPWARDLVNECTVFPSGAHDDQVDALSGAFTILAERSHVVGAAGPVNRKVSGAKSQLPGHPKYHPGRPDVPRVGQDRQ